jgi:hypothetical protein
MFAANAKNANNILINFIQKLSINMVWSSVIESESKMIHLLGVFVLREGQHPKMCFWVIFSHQLAEKHTETLIPVQKLPGNQVQSLGVNKKWSTSHVFLLSGRVYMRPNVWLEESFFAQRGKNPLRNLSNPPKVQETRTQGQKINEASISTH